MKLLLVHMTWLWTSLLGAPVSTCAACGHPAREHQAGPCAGRDEGIDAPPCDCGAFRKAGPDEAARAGGYAAERLPRLLAALAEGQDRVLVVLDGKDPWRRALDPEHRERQDAWAAEAWTPMRHALAATPWTLVEAQPYRAEIAVEVGGALVTLDGRRPSARDILATIAAWWGGTEMDHSTSRLTIASGRTSVAALTGHGARILSDLKRRADGDGWTWRVEDEAAVRTRLGYDPRLAADVAALASLDGIGAETARALVAGGKLRKATLGGYGSALVAVQMASSVREGDKLPGLDKAQMTALRKAAESGGARILRALAIHGLRDDAPLDVAALVGGAGDGNEERSGALRLLRERGAGRADDRRGEAMRAGDARVAEGARGEVVADGPIATDAPADGVGGGLAALPRQSGSEPVGRHEVAAATTAAGAEGSTVAHAEPPEPAEAVAGAQSEPEPHRATSAATRSAVVSERSESMSEQAETVNEDTGEVARAAPTAPSSEPERPAAAPAQAMNALSTEHAPDEGFVATAVEPSRALTLDPSDPRWALALQPASARDAFVLAKVLHRSQMFPKFRSPDAIFAVLTMGRERGISALLSLQGMHVIEGKVELAADMIAALVLRSGKAKRFAIVESTDERAVYEAQRLDDAAPIRVEFTKAHAAARGLWGKGNWAKMPDVMLAHRCCTKAARLKFPDVVMGLYGSGEIGEARRSEAEIEEAPRGGRAA